MDTEPGAGEPAGTSTGPDIEELLRLGEDLFDQGNYLKAIEQLDRVLALDPVHVRALILKGRAYAERGTYSEAMVYLKRAIEHEPENADAWFYRGYTEQHMGRYTDADEAYTKAVSINPGYAKVWAAKAAALLKIGKYELAIEAYEHALAIDAENAILQQEKKLATMLHNFRMKTKTEVRAVREEAARAVTTGEETGKNIRDIAMKEVIAPIGGAISGIVAKLGKGKKE
jgi:tetratricopeptide (TPR) repeat protein